MKVINLLSNDFTEKCFILKKIIEDDFKPDLVVGIATGGELIVNEMKFFENPIVILKKQRVTTKYKKKIKVGALLKKLPYEVTNKLRVMEIFFHETRYNLFRKFNSKKITDENIEIVSGDLKVINEKLKIIIIDDAIDSGSTLLKCHNFISKHAAEGCIIKTAVINSTFKRPMIEPNYVLYDRKIIRYPWAEDKRNEKDCI